MKLLKLLRGLKCFSWNYLPFYFKIVVGDDSMNWDFELLADKDVSEVKRLVNEYSMLVGNQRIGIKVYIDENGFYQMKTSHFYQGKNNAGAYITTAANFETEQEALNRAKNQLLAFFDGQGIWHDNDDYYI